jgi:lysophospholipid acyltransferase (LPLAT)-like uncharacterized protein
VKINPAFLAPPAASFVRLWSSTLRYRQEGYESVERLKAEGRLIVFAIWHDELFPYIHLHRNERVIAVVSQSSDGELLARVLAANGFLLARGSSSRGGLKALVSAKRQMHALGSNAVFTVDGPRGPRHKVKEGAVFLADRADAYLVPARVSMSPVKVFHKAWDRFQLPLPFARCAVRYGTPYKPRLDARSEDDLKREAGELEYRLNTLMVD